MKHRYAVVDLETTGGIPKRDKIIEIGIVVFDGKEIVGSFQSLINPERTIPANITRITGITNEMVEDAPKFYEVAKKVIEMTESCIFVAHNVRFDYGFLIHEFKSLGFTYTRRNLCTVKLSRKTFPSLSSYSLGNLIQYFGIEVNNRHRAYDDAYATAIILAKVFEMADSQNVIDELVADTLKLTKLPDGLKPESILELPQECGVYYFLNEEKDIIYIGKSKNIQKRVKQHFSKSTKKTDRLFRTVKDIDFEITGSELVSLLKESKEIKNHQPSVNKIQKTRNYSYVVVLTQDKSGYFRLEAKNKNAKEKALSFYGTKRSALEHIEQISEEFQLCHKINGLEKNQHACFNYGINKCLGACIGNEMVFDYNQRFMKAIPFINRLFDENFLVIENGKGDEEKALILVENGHFQGYGFVDFTNGSTDVESLKEYVKPEPFNPEADLIIRNYIWSKPELQIIYF